jgi:hypothetical protein
MGTSDLLSRECFGKLCKTGFSAKARKIRKTESFRQMIESAALPPTLVVRQLDKKVRKKRLHVRRRRSEKQVERVNHKK